MDALRRLLAQFRTYWAGLGRARRAALVAATVLLAVALAVVGYFSTNQGYRTLYSDLAPEDAAAMRTTLTGANIPSRLEAGGDGHRRP